MGKAWIGNFKGPKGDQGEKGDPGPQGPKGEQGPTGLVNAEAVVEFEDYTSGESDAPGLEEALGGIISGESLRSLFSSIKAFCMNAGAAADKMIGDVYSLEKDYSARDYVIRDNVLYRFTADKEAGEWDETVVVATTIAAELQAVSANIPGFVLNGTTLTITLPDSKGV